MATIDNKEIIDDLIANNGHYPGPDDEPADPPVLTITEYTTPEGRTAWGICYPGDPANRYAETFYVRSPQVIFVHQPHWDCNHPAGTPRGPE